MSDKQAADMLSFIMQRDAQIETKKEKAKVIDLQCQQPHYTIQVAKGDVHVVPCSFFDKVTEGKAAISNLDDWEDIITAIVSDWHTEQQRRLQNDN